MKEPNRANEYQPRDVAAVRSVLIELGQVLGSWREKFVIIGGAVPWLLLPGARPPHIGTLDIDLDLDVDALTDGGYATLVEALEKAGYERDKPGLKPFQLRRWVKVDGESDSVAVLIDLLMPEGAKTGKNRPKLLEGLRVQEVIGGEFPFQHYLRKEFEGTMPDGRSNTVQLLIATIPAFLVMKGYALANRVKDKDAYDIYFSVRHYEGGPQKLADACRPLLQESIAREGFAKIAQKFEKETSFGPVTVRRFLEESEALGDMNADQVQTDAFQQVAAFLSELGITS